MECPRHREARAGRSAHRAGGHRTAAALGLADLRVVSVEHPVGGIDPDEVRRRADGIVDEVLGLLTGTGGAP